MQSRRRGVRSIRVLCLAVGLLLACGLHATRGEPAHEAAGAMAAGLDSSERQGADPQADHIRTDTILIESYEAPGIVVDRFSTWIVEPSRSSSFEWVGKYDDQARDVSFSWTGEGECTLRESSVRCTDGIESFQLSFRRTYTPTVENDHVTLELVHYHGRRIDYSFDLFYPTSLKHVGSKPAPDFEAPGHLRWNSPRMTRFKTQVTFLDLGAAQRRWPRLAVAGGAFLLLAAAFGIWLKRRAQRRGGPADGLDTAARTGL